MDRLYFAYGSNLLVEQMTARIGAADLLERGVRIARLEGHRLTFRPMEPDGPAYADILPGEGFVLGIVYRLRESELQTLDRFEKGYDRRTVAVVGPEGETLHAEAYYSKATAPQVGGVPSEAYLGRITTGAGQRGLPEAYIAGIVAKAATGTL